MVVDHAITDRFIGKAAITYGLALYKLKKQSLLEQVLFAMKYKNQPKIGELLGHCYGNSLSKYPSIVKTIDAIVPVPLHHKRLQERGYNQSDFFAKGLSVSLQIPFYPTCIERTRNTPSQIHKSKEERMVNVKDAFKVTQSNLLTDKHLLLVDDILTTGATLIACTKALLAKGAGQVSIATIAVVEEA
jgi:ComF family protein